MSQEFTELLDTVRHYESLEDSIEYRLEWSLGSESWEFEESIEQRLESVIAEYAIKHGLTWDVVNEQVCNAL